MNEIKIDDIFAFYESKPEIYEILSKAEDIDKTILKTILHDISFKNKFVLDLGAGTGKFSIPISSKAKFVYSLDTSEKALSVLRKKAKNKRIKTLKGTFGNIPLPNESVDIVLSTWAFPSHSSNRESDLKEILRVIKRGGKIIVVENYPGGEYHFIKKKFLSNPGKHCENTNRWLLSKKFKRKVVEVLVDLHSKKHIEKVFTGPLPLERIKDYLYRKNKTGFNLKASIFYGERK
jgi:ubiquinone/menaquinone biosynthesis C-methylase UbiE